MRRATVRRLRRRHSAALDGGGSTAAARRAGHGRARPSVGVDAAYVLGGGGPDGMATGRKTEPRLRAHRGNGREPLAYIGRIQMRQGEKDPAAGLAGLSDDAAGDDVARRE